MSITTWNRLECDVVFDDPARGLTRGLSAELFDPLWLLARQRQLGEFRSEDGGSLVHALITSAAHPINDVTIAGRTTPFDAAVPLEAVVEREPSSIDLRLRIRGGVMLADLLGERNLVRLRTRIAEVFAFPDATLDGLANGIADAERIWRASQQGTLRSDLGVTAAEGTEFDAVIAAWSAWFRARARLDVADAWIPDRLEHRFALGASAPGGAIQLEAREYPGGRLDWDAFAITGASPSASVPPRITETHTLPLQVDIPGMPVVRYWEIEDPRFDAARVSVGPGDATRLLLVEFALTFASDWFLAPVPAPVGTLVGIQDVIVKDTFGVLQRIRSAEQVRSDPSWALWRLTDTTGQQRGASLLFVPPPPAGGLESDAIEEVALVRDELANLAWAIELTVPSPVGGGRFVDRRTPLAGEVASEVAGDPDQLRYVPFPALPPDRVPLTRLDRDGQTWLARATVVDDRIVIQPVEGRFLTDAFRVRDEEVGIDGIILTRRHQLALGRDGQRHLWIARAKRPGASRPGERVAFDALV
jgi:hypothetical protein